MTIWGKIRIAILLFILATVAQQALLKDGAPDWKKTLYVTLYPINADGSAAAQTAIANLNADKFAEIETYLAQQRTHFQADAKAPFAVRLGATVDSLPPMPPAGGSQLDTLLWSLKFRYWAYKHSPKSGVPPDIRQYLLYFDPATHPVLKHSTALSKGRIGLVNVFADKHQFAQNNIVIAHELLHTVAATDHYDLATGMPRYPEGYANPQQQPRYPQTSATLMGGRIPLADDKATMPDSLDHTVVSALTAKEIGWIK